MLIISKEGNLEELLAALLAPADKSSLLSVLPASKSHESLRLTVAFKATDVMTPDRSFLRDVSLTKMFLFRSLKLRCQSRLFVWWYIHLFDDRKLHLGLRGVDLLRKANVVGLFGWQADIEVGV